jgi:IS605 OrfB family transposase
MTKVLKLYLYCDTHDKQDNEVDYQVVNKILWNLQDETRSVKNKAVQLCWEWFHFQSDYKAKYGEYPKDKDVLNYTLAGYIYNRLTIDNHLNTHNISISIPDVCKHFKCDTKEYMRGTKSIVEYKRNQPLDVHNKNIRLNYEDGKFKIRLSMLNKSAMEEYNLNQFTFNAVVADKFTRTILERCYDGIYKISASKLIYDKTRKKDKPMWQLNLCYTFAPADTTDLDKDTILGVDLGIAKPIMASVYGDKSRFIIDGNEILAFRARVEQRKKVMGRQTKYCGEGRIGHGVKKRIEHVNKVADKIACFRETTNFKYAKALIQYAVDNNCGTIQMEDLSGISSDDAFLKQWSYYDLQQKIINKAAEYGIAVVKINPKYTSQRCSRCGYIHKDNRLTQRKFECLQCGFKENADYNASQNLSIRDIDKIIESANVK